MASVFLSPSLQEFNPYVGEGDEEEYQIQTLQQSSVVVIPQQQ